MDNVKVLCTGQPNMKLSEAITELVELLIADEPPCSDWVSIYGNAARRTAHHERLDELRAIIDGVSET